MQKARYTLLLCLSALFVACNNSTTPQQTAPTVESFTADSTIIAEGESTTLRWSGVSNSATLSLNPGIRDVTGKSSITVSPVATTTYILTATNEAGRNEYKVTITVSASALYNHTVTNNSDSGEGSLRQAVLDAVDGDVIGFDESVLTITLISGEIMLDKSLTIDGNITIDGNSSNRIFTVGEGSKVILNDLTIAKGNAYDGEGGGINNNGELILTGTTIIRTNRATSGGGVANKGKLLLQDNSSISGNTAFTDMGLAFGGGVNNTGTLILEDNSSISGNTASTSGGGVASMFGDITLSGNTIIGGNTAAFGGGVLNSSESTLTLSEASSIGTNTALEDGGGVNNLGTIKLEGNSTIIYNSSLNGGGVYNDEGSLTLQGSASIRDNEAISNGGGVFNVYGILSGADYDGIGGNDNIFGNSPDQFFQAIITSLSLNY